MFRLAALLYVLPLTAMASYEPPPDWPQPMSRPMLFHKIQVDRFEAGSDEQGGRYLWDAQAWWGSDQHRLWFKTEGEGEFGEQAEAAELQVLYSRLWTAFWDVQLGVRYDFDPDPERAYLVAGVQGLAPYRLEVDAAAFFSENGDSSLRAELEYDLYLTQRLILQPRIEINAAFTDVPEQGIGSGLNETELGLRLRYELKREVAPYIGVEWSRLHGETRDWARDAEASSSNIAVVAGVRLVF